MISKSLLGQRIEWLMEMRLLWVNAAFITATLGVLLVIHPKQEVCIRWWGMLLQFVGIYSVVRELNDKAAIFGLPSRRHWVRDWWRRYPQPGTRVVTGVGESKGSSSAMGHGRCLIFPAQGAPIDEQLEAVQRALQCINADVGGLSQAAEIDRADRLAGDEKEAAARAQLASRLEGLLKAVSTGSLPLSLVGVMWLGVGVFLSSTSQELAKWIACVMR